MYIPNPYFKNIPQIGDLILDHIFIEDGYPILFTCITNDKIFLCLCRTLTPDQKWVLSEIKFEVLEKLIKNEISITDAFKNNESGKSCIVKWNQSFISENYEVMPTLRLPLHELPENDVFLEDTDEDAYLYLEQVKNRIQSSIEKNIQSQLESEEHITGNTFSTIELMFSKKIDYLFHQDNKNLEINTAMNVMCSIKSGHANMLTADNDEIYAVKDNIVDAA